MSAKTIQGKESSNVIPKSELKDGHYYIGRTFQRGMPIGLWSAKDNIFRCVHEAGFNQYHIYEMNHIEDDKGGVVFEPVKEIIL